MTVLAAVVVLIVCSAGLVRHSSSSDTQGLEDSSERFSCSIVQFDAVERERERERGLFTAIKQSDDKTSGC